MNILRQTLLAGACAFALVATSGNLMAQGGGGGGGFGGGRGNFDPAQMKEMRLADLRDQMEVKDDAEWSAIQGKLSKAFDASMTLRGMTMQGMMGRGGRGGRGARTGGNNAADDPQAQRPQRRNNMFGEASTTLEALQKAIDDKAPAAELKAKLAAYRAELKDRQAKFDAASEDLRSVLTARQEAIAAVAGLVN